ncbi:MAG: DUF378 domain-containing protein [Candidatus Aenigmarchaeota archaeon]|nr:DUF378 domain-containing protein [Candidatus Aenigmarchaeota archaeon]
MGALDWLVFALLVVGALNWGLIGIANINVVETIFSFSSLLLKAIYILVGLAGLWKIYKVLMAK